MLTTPLNAFSIYPTPQSPLHRGSNLTIRCQYYEVFLLNGAFTASGCLLCVLEYALGARLASLKLGGQTVQLMVFLAISLPFQICILDFPFADYRTILLPYAATGCAFALLALAHRSWESGGSTLATRDREQLLHLQDPVSTNDEIYLASENCSFNPILAAFRSGLYVCTSLCIFSRDLPCWNNRFSKSKAFGTGLMDLGIGCFVLCLGTVGPTAVRPLQLVRRSLALRRCLRQTALLCCLGLCVSFHRAWQFGRSRGRHDRFSAEWREYGVHWSAFHSLAAARLFGSCLELLVLPRRAPPLLAAVAVAAAHEVALSWGGLAELVLAPGMAEPYNRSSLIGQNREGLASLPGLITLYLAGLQLGRWARDWTVSGDGTGRRRGRLVASGRILGLLVGALAWRPLVLASGGRLLPESRRLVNPSYCAWVLAFSCFCVLSAGLLAELRRRLAAGRCLLRMRHLDSFDRAGLATFLMGNLTTGMFNALVGVAGVNRESVIGGGGICFALVLGYSMATQATALRLCEGLRKLRAGGGCTRREAGMRTV